MYLLSAYNAAPCPCLQGIVPIIVSWFFSPIFTGIAAAFFFFCIRSLVGLTSNNYMTDLQRLPIPAGRDVHNATLHYNGNEIDTGLPYACNWI
jgi:phosphate/sulfate permease